MKSFAIRRLSITVMASLLIVFSSAAWPTVYYVNPSATGMNDGASWADGFTSLQAAVDTVGTLGGGEIWVKSGVYSPGVAPNSTDSFEALDPDSVDVIGEERTMQYVSSESLPSECHLTILYVQGDVTRSGSAATFGFTTDQDSFADRLAELMRNPADVLVFANHPSWVVGAGDTRVAVEDLTEAANASAMDAMEIKDGQDVVKWDYVLAHLDDQSGDCSKIIWGLRADDQHHIANIDFRTYGVMMGCIPTESQDPVYAERRLALKDMIRRGSFVSLPSNSKCGMPTYTFESSGGSASRMQVRVYMENIGGATSANIRFYGCDYATGNTPGTLLFTAPLTLNADNTASYYLTTTGTSSGQPLSVQQKANIKYIRPVITWMSPGSREAYLQPVRIRSNGNWWGGPAHTLAGSQGVIGPSPYPIGGADTGETIYFNTHTHTTASDGDSSPSAMRAAYWDDYTEIDATKPRFTTLTDHDYRTPFQIPVASVVEMKPSVQLYGGFAGTETLRDQRDWAAHPTALVGSDEARCLLADGKDWSGGNEITIDGFVLRNANLSSNPGGGMYVLACMATVRNCSFETNAARNGGGITAAEGAFLDIADSVFNGNSSTGINGGGGLACLGSYASVTGCTFSGNSATRGGGIHSGASYLTAQGCTFTGNTGASTGGAIHLSISEVVLDSCSIRDNVAGDGAGVWMGSSFQSVTNSIFAGNQASGTSGRGGAIYDTGDFIGGLYAGNTMVGNTAYHGGGIYQEGCSSTVANNIIAFNSSGIFACDSQATFANNDVYGNVVNYTGVSPGSGDISADPLFVNSALGDYHLTAGSLCIDAGNASIGDLPEQDMDGQYRVWGIGPDIGADEYWPLAASPRSLADESPIGWSKALVTGAFTDFFYVESDDRAYGIRVNKPDHGLSAGMRADITGVLETDDGERCIDAQTAVHNGSGSIEPLLLLNRSIGGGDWQYNPITNSGQEGVAGAQDVNNIGLLICTMGRVTYACPSYFYIDDGSTLDDGSGFVGVKVLPQGLAVPPWDSYQRVTGISSCYRSGGLLKRLIRATRLSP